MPDFIQLHYDKKNQTFPLFLKTETIAVIKGTAQGAEILLDLEDDTVSYSVLESADEIARKLGLTDGEANIESKQDVAATADLPLDLASLQERCRAGETFSFHPFFGHTVTAGKKPGKQVFSQFYEAEFTVNGTTYRWAEQFMMAGKARLFDDTDILEQILKAETPKDCKALGRKVSPFSEEEWAKLRFDLVTCGNVAKFGQTEELRAILEATGDDVLVEAAPRDRVWGIGMGASNPDVNDPTKWRGANLLGFALMRTRAILRGDLSAPDIGALGG
ncbi:NADAR family protein [Labrenzia sp. VG12]|uniref:NADAR family protein n=1 Tax=Labrenzia sp. VG12 TaxID=2021862 RepID=UPI000B8C65DD|nr:NADAR family protein [Labrenzia sp. VG12]ASP32428.1 hypothetical protein CHH27_03540 [Labrenzia sp. VG12]